VTNNDQTAVTQISHENLHNSESQIPEEMEIDGETLQLIYKLEISRSIDISNYQQVEICQ